MAIYHTRVKTFSRAKGHASTAAAAYRAGLLIADERTGTQHDYRRRGGVVETRCLAPDEAPEWATKPGALWCAVEVAERRKDATVAREFEIALPYELTDAQRADLTWDIARELVDRYHFAIQASIHEPQTPDGRNYHAHLLATTRRLDATGLADKTRELDGGPSGRGEVEWIRAMVARQTNAHLSAANIAARVDHRSLEDQATGAIERGDIQEALHLSRRPTAHVGKNATALHRRGEDCERVEDNHAIGEANQAQWDAAITALGEEGRLMGTTDGHRHERALLERVGAAETESPLSVAAGVGMDDPHSTPDREEATRVAFGEIAGLWAEGFVLTVNATFKATARLLQHKAARLAVYIHEAVFRADVRVLLDLFKTLKRDALRFQRRLKAEDRVEHRLVRAEQALERFDSDYPTPGTLTRQEWTRRRARRLRAVQRQREAYRRAHEATGPEAQTAYNARAAASAQQVEAWAKGMLARYPVQADQAPAPVAEQEPRPEAVPAGPRPSP